MSWAEATCSLQTSTLFRLTSPFRYFPGINSSIWQYNLFTLLTQETCFPPNYSRYFVPKIHKYILSYFFFKLIRNSGMYFHFYIRKSVSSVNCKKKNKLLKWGMFMLDTTDIIRAIMIVYFFFSSIYTNASLMHVTAINNR